MTASGLDHGTQAATLRAPCLFMPDQFNSTPARAMLRRLSMQA